MSHLSFLRRPCRLHWNLPFCVACNTKLPGPSLPKKLRKNTCTVFKSRFQNLHPNFLLPVKLRLCRCFFGESPFGNPWHCVVLGHWGLATGMSAPPPPQKMWKVILTRSTFVRNVWKWEHPRPRWKTMGTVKPRGPCVWRFVYHSFGLASLWQSACGNQRAEAKNLFQRSQFREFVGRCSQRMNIDVSVAQSTAATRRATNFSSVCHESREMEHVRCFPLRIVKGWCRTGD